MNDLLKLFLGFLLTTVVGGLLGYYFQNRTWRHQFRIRLIEADLAAATKLFDELSRLMDKRLYRMRQVHWKLKKPEPTELIELAMRGYREVLYEWNDALNRNLSLAETYFGADIKRRLEDSIYEEFSRIGGALESGYLKFRESKERYEWKQPAEDLARLGDRVYLLNVKMIHSIQQRQEDLIRPESQSESRGEAAPNTRPQAGSKAPA